MRLSQTSPQKEMPSLSDASLCTDPQMGRSHGFLARLDRLSGNRFACATAIAGLFSAGLQEKTLGGTVMAASDRPALEALAAAQDDLVWVEASANGNTIHASGTLIRGADSDWVLTAAHTLIYSSGTIQLNNITVGNGSSYINDRGQTSSVTQMIANPTYTPGSFQVGDWIFLRLEDRISDENLRFSIGATPEIGATILLAGFGTPSSLAEGTLPNQGNALAFNTSFNFAQPASYSASMYDSGRFTGQHDSGFGTGGDSGGIVKYFNSATNQWDSLGTIVAGNSNTQATFFLNFNTAEQSFHDTLNNVVQPGVIPEPGSLYYFSGAALPLLLRRRRR